MRLFLKILKLLAIVILAVLIILFSASFILQNKVVNIILKSLNTNISTKLDVGSVRLSFIRNFPKASLEMKDILVHSSSDFNSASFARINTDTLFAAKFVSVEFRTTDILKGIYNIERIKARTGVINLFTDSSGLVNYDISVKTEQPGENDFTINLESINLTYIKIHYNNLATNLIINGLIGDGRFRSRISGDDVDFIAGADIQINSFQLYNTVINKPINANLDLVLKSSDNGIQFNKGTLSVETWDFGLEGFISSDNNLDLNISGHNIDIAKIKNYLPEKYMTMVSGYDPEGTLVVSGSIKGSITRTTNPHIEITCQLNNGHVVYGKSDIAINNLSFAGYYSNGTDNKPATSSVSIRDLKAKLGSAEYSGSFKLSHLDHPVTEFSLKGKLIPYELKKFFNLNNISTTGGSVDFELKPLSILWPKEKINVNYLIDLKPEVDMVFNSFSIGLGNDRILVNKVVGNLSVSSSIAAKNLEFSYKGQRIKVDGEFRNLPEWLAGRPVKMIVSGDVSFNRFIPEVFISNPYQSEVTTIQKTVFSLPENMILDIRFKIDSLTYKAFSSAKVAGTLNYKPGLLTFKTLEMESLNGMISGSGFIFQNNSKSVIARGSFNIKHIDVNKAFTTFDNFGQSFLKSENISGNLTGSLSLLLPFDSLLKPVVKSINAEGKYILSDGALINFEPVKQLSSFIELSELENIRFETLENDFFIRNNFLYIPQMDIKSSAVDLSVSGKHSFDNDYEYHIKMLLSEVLSKKRKKNKMPVTEFGIIEDDGLGRTSLLLKIVGKGEEAKVGYDLKAAGGEIKNNIKTERQTLKTILNEEYGWFKADSAPKQKTEEKKPRFKISWEETDSVKSVPGPSVVKKGSIVRNLFKKK
jgi:hypothetical protein